MTVLKTKRKILNKIWLKVQNTKKKKKINENKTKNEKEAALHGFMGILTKLIHQHSNLDINQSDKRGHTAISLAATFGKLEVIKVLLSHKDIDVNSEFSLLVCLFLLYIHQICLVCVCVCVGVCVCLCDA